MGSSITIAIGVALSLWAAPVSFAFGPEWVEGDVGDAGSDPDSAQSTSGQGIITAIRGSLTFDGTPSNGLLDLEDVYLICISDPDNFSATTEAVLGSRGGFGAFAEFDSQLYLFDATGLGLLGNQSTGQLDDAGFDFATLLSEATDLTGQTIPGPGNYLLAITSFGQPTGNGLAIFSFESPTEISGPDGEGAGQPLEEWNPALGACCIDEQCVLLTEDDCNNAQGTYFGDGTVCSDGFDDADTAFHDISETGTPVPFASDDDRTDDNDDVGAQVPIGFTFNHFGNDYTTVAVSTNGYLTFSTDPDDWDERFGEHFPNDTSPNDVIAPLWNDYDVDTDARHDDGQVHYFSDGDQLIVQWTNVQQDYGIGFRKATFQVVLHADSNCIEFRYKRLDHFLNLLATSIGIENADGTIGVNVSPFTVKEDESIRFCPGGVSCAERGVGGGPLDYRITLTGACFADTPCPGDLTGDGKSPLPNAAVDMYDLLALLANWGENAPGADIAEPSNVVDVLDLLALLANWGPCS